MSIAIVPKTEPSSSTTADSQDSEKQYASSKSDIEQLEQNLDGKGTTFTSDDVSSTEEESAQVLRKIDWHLMPIMCSVYAIQFVRIASRWMDAEAQANPVGVCDHCLIKMDKT